MDAVIAVLPGDGVGPEVTAAAVAALARVAEAGGHRFRFDEHAIGGAAIDRCGVPLPAEVLAACRAADAVLLGAVGGPRWDALPPERRPEQGLLELRQALGVYANLRPVRCHPALAAASPLRPERLAGTDLLFVRELLGGLYFGRPRGRTVAEGRRRAVDTLAYDEDEIARVVDLAFRLAARRRGKVTSIDKANVLASSRLWREVTGEVAARHPGVALEHLLVDAAAMRLLFAPQSFDVVVTENLMGDILTDEAAALAGSLGLLPSASLGDGRPGLFEPVHGSAPALAGRDVANPLGAVLSAALLLRHGLELAEEAAAVEHAVEQALSDGERTADLGGTLGTRAMTAAVLARLAASGG